MLDVLTGAGIEHWVGGGWGVDALVGRQTREHRDLDLAVDAARLDETLELLEELDYTVETDWLPIRVEVAATTGWVDVHPVVIAPDGSAVQAGPGDTTFDYPADAFVVGTLGERAVPCLSRTQQVDFHQGYEPRPQDQHDLALLTRIEP